MELKYREKVRTKNGFYRDLIGVVKRPLGSNEYSVIYYKDAKGNDIPKHIRNFTFKSEEIVPVSAILEEYEGFKYGDRVKVNGGFYQGVVGILLYECNDYAGRGTGIYYQISIETDKNGFKIGLNDEHISGLSIVYITIKYLDIIP